MTGRNKNDDRDDDNNVLFVSPFYLFGWAGIKIQQVADAGRESPRRGTTSHPAAERRAATQQGADCESRA